MGDQFINIKIHMEAIRGGKEERFIKDVVDAIASILDDKYNLWWDIEKCSYKQYDKKLRKLITVMDEETIFNTV